MRRGGQIYSVMDWRKRRLNYGGDNLPAYPFRAPKPLFGDIIH